MSCRTDSRVEFQLLDAEAPAQCRARPSRPAGAAGGRLGCAGGLGLRNEGSGRTRPAAEALPRVKLIALASRQHACRRPAVALRSEEHTSELQSLMRISYAVFCLKKTKLNNSTTQAKNTQ